ncbi:MAG: mandelate racemase/muconate lactonizing enzyme family protein [Solirubrobacterales bacterium]
MRLEELEVIPYSLPFRDPYVTARGELRERRLVLLRIRAEGLEGIGETASLSLRGGPDVDEIARELREVCWPALTELEFDPDRIWSALARCRNRGASAQALAAVDIALHDLAGNSARVPVWRLLPHQTGGSSDAKRVAPDRSALASAEPPRIPRPVRCNATLPAANPTGLRSMTERWVADGFRTFKLKVGMAGDVTQVKTVRETVGPQALIRLDANAAWTVADAAEQLRSLAPFTIELVEQPVGTLGQMAELRESSRVKLAADESVVTPRDAREAVELSACPLATTKLAKAGGIIAALEVAAEIPVYLSSALEGPVGISAAAHVVQALAGGPGDAGVAHGLATERLFSESVGRGVRAAGDELHLEERPGLGVELDPEALAARRIGT